MKKICERRVYEETGGKEEEKSGNFREIVKSTESYRKDQVLWISVVMETLYNMYAFERVKDF